MMKVSELQFDNFLKKALIHSVYNEKFRNSISKKEFNKFVEWIQELPSEDVRRILYYGTILTERKPPKSSYIIKKILSIGFASASLLLPGGSLLYIAANYVKNLYNWKCVRHCVNKKSKELCYRKCDVKSNEETVKTIENELRKCNREPIEKDREKCRKKLFKLLEKFKQKNFVSTSRLQFMLSKGK